MRSIKDNSYIFSAAKYCFGEVIAERSRHGGEAVGRNVFEYLKMSDKEISFFTSRYDNNKNDIICAVSERNGQNAVLFFNFWASSASLCLAVVIDMPLTKVAKAVVEGNIAGCFASDGILRAAELANKQSDLIYDMEAPMYLSGILGQIMKISSLELGYDREPAESIRASASAASEFIGVDIEFDTYVNIEEMFDGETAVFDGMLCSASILMFAALSRAWSCDRRFHLVVVRGVSGCVVEMSFKPYGDGWKKAVNYLKVAAVANRAVPIYVRENETEVSLVLIPYYEDVGFIGVKGNNTVLDLAWYEKVFSYR